MNRNKNAETEKEIEAEIEVEQKKALEEIFDIIAKNSDSSIISNFFNCLFTPSELKDFATRWLILKEIENGTTQRDIASKYHISLCKITRGSKELKKEGSVIKKLIDNSKVDANLKAEEK